MFHRLTRLRRWIVALVGVAMLTSISPQPAHAIGCGDTLNVRFQPTSTDGLPEPGSTNIFVGTATRTDVGLLSDTYTFTATDIASGQTITGTMTVSTFDCGLSKIMPSGKGIGTVEDWEYV